MEVICNPYAAIDEAETCAAAAPPRRSDSFPVRDAKRPLRVPSGARLEKSPSQDTNARSLRGSGVLLVPADTEKLLPHRPESLVGEETSARNRSSPSPRSGHRKRGPDGSPNIQASGAGGRRPNGSLAADGKQLHPNLCAGEEGSEPQQPQRMIEDVLETEETAAQQTLNVPSPSTSNSIQAFLTNPDSLHVSFTSASTCTPGDDERRYALLIEGPLSKAIWSQNTFYFTSNIVLVHSGSCCFASTRPAGRRTAA